MGFIILETSEMPVFKGFWSTICYKNFYQEIQITKRTSFSSVVTSGVCCNANEAPWSDKWQPCQVRSLVQCFPPIGWANAMLAWCPIISAVIAMFRETGCENVEMVSILWQSEIVLLTTCLQGWLERSGVGGPRGSEQLLTQSQHPTQSGNTEIYLHIQGETTDILFCFQN